MRPNCLRRRGFTLILIELLCVLSIIGVLVGLVISNDLGIRQSIAQHVGVKSLSDPLCAPPWCDSLGGLKFEVQHLFN